jgi:hypothetical protein
VNSNPVKNHSIAKDREPKIHTKKKAGATGATGPAGHAAIDPIAVSFFGAA